MVGHKQHLTLTVIRPAQGSAGTARDPSLLALQIETTREPAKLGVDVGQSTVAKYMAKRKRPPSQGWRAFLRNHADGVASMDLTVGARCPVVSFWMSNSTDVRTDFDILSRNL
jgi:hypothetical protein